MHELLSGKTDGWRPDVFIQNRPIKFTDEKMERCVVTDRWKLILNQERPPELYDRTAEFKDRDNLYSVADKAIINDLYARLERWGKFVKDALVEELIKMYRG